MVVSPLDQVCVTGRVIMGRSVSLSGVAPEEKEKTAKKQTTEQCTQRSVEAKNSVATIDLSAATRTMTKVGKSQHTD